MNADISEERPGPGDFLKPQHFAYINVHTHII